MALTPLGQLLHDKLNTNYDYYVGGDVNLLKQYSNGEVVEYRKPESNSWDTVSPWFNEGDNPRVSNKRYHFRIIREVARYAFMYMDGEYIGLDNTEEHHPLTNVVVTTKNGEITNILYVGP